MGLAINNSQQSTVNRVPSFFVSFASSRFNNTNSSDPKKAIIKKSGSACRRTAVTEDEKSKLNAQHPVLKVIQLSS